MYTTEYDGLIQRAAGSFLPQWDWNWWKAQLIAESNLDTNATSPVGAQGLSQIMPATWPEIRDALAFPPEATPYNPIFGIRGGAYYMGKLRQQWKSPRPEEDRRRLTQASYNAGLGNILKAQKWAKGATDYATIIAALPHVTGDSSKETIAYVERIQRIFDQLTAA